MARPVAIVIVSVWTIALCSFDLCEQHCVETNEHMQLDSVVSVEDGYIVPSTFCQQSAALRAIIPGQSPI